MFTLTLLAALLAPLAAGVAAETTASSRDEHGKLVVCFASKGDYSHTPASEAGLRGLADLLHKYGYRGTYYLKPATVRACQADLKEWREKYGDEVGWFADGCALKSAAAELAQLRELATGQPVRSAGQLRYGKNWVELFQKHGVESVWGRCYEQTATDGITDRGCPFGFYYARPDCFKAPNPGSGGVISVPWLSNDLNLVFRTAQQSTFTFDPNDAQDIGVTTPGDDSFWVAELNEYKKQTKYNKIVPLVIQQEIEEFDFTTRKEWKESGSAILENLLKLLKREGIQVVTVTEAVDLYKAAYPEATPPTYGLFGNIAATTPIIRTNKSLQVVTAPFAIVRKAEFKCFGSTFNGFYATGRIGRTWYYYDPKGARLDEFGKNFSYFDKAGLLVFEEGNSTPVRITPYSNLPADAYRTAILPEMSPWFDTQKFIPTADVKMVKSERELRVTANTVASRSLVFSGDSLPYGVMLWGDFSAYRVPPNAPVGTKILGDEGLFIPWVLKEGENHLDLVLGVELSPVRAASQSIAVGAVARTTEPHSATVIRELRPLSVRGVNYFPRETPWGGMWTKTPAEVWEKDMALVAALGCNTVRTFLQFGPHIEQAGLLEKDGTPTPAYLDKIDALLAAAWRHGIRLILCFEFRQDWLDARWRNGLTKVVTAHRNDGRVLMWDLMNEPDDDPKWTDATRAFLTAALPLIKQLDTHHLTTVGLAFRCDKLKEVGLPDVMQYHEYAGKDVFFKEGPKRVLVTCENQRRVGGVRPLLIGEFGMSTARDEQHGAAPELRARMSAAPGTEAEQARLYEIVLTGAEQGHAAGALAWCLHDYPIQNPNESHFGLVRADGSLKPAANVLREAFSRWSKPCNTPSH